MEMPKIKRLKSPEEENARLRTLPAEAMLDKEALQVALGRNYRLQTRGGKPLNLYALQPAWRNVVLADLQVCHCRPAAMMLSVRRLMHIYQGVSQNWRSNEGFLVTVASGSYCVERVFKSTTIGYTAFTTLTA